MQLVLSSGGCGVNLSRSGFSAHFTCETVHSCIGGVIGSTEVVSAVKYRTLERPVKR